MNRVKFSCWSVKNFKTDKKYDLLTDVIRIHENNGWKMMDITFTMSNSKRPGTTAVTADATASPKKTEEITYVFIKE